MIVKQEAVPEISEAGQRLRLALAQRDHRKRAEEGLDARQDGEALAIGVDLLEPSQQVGYINTGMHGNLHDPFSQKVAEGRDAAQTARPGRPDQDGQPVVLHALGQALLYA